MPGEKLNLILGRAKKIEYTTNRLVDSIFYGFYKSAFKGRGIEFTEIREYQPGDDIRSIDWNVTARTGALHVKEFIEERDLNVIGTKKSLKRDVAAELTCALCLGSRRNNDRIGLVLFSDRVQKYIPPSKKRTQTTHILKEMLTLENPSGCACIESALDFIRKVMKKRSIIFILSDFEEDPEKYEKKLKTLNQKHDIVCIKITDIREKEMPDIGYIEFVDAETGEQLVVDTSDPVFRECYVRLSAEDDAKIASFFRRNKIDQVNITTDNDWVNPMIAFFKKRNVRLIK